MDQNLKNVKVVLYQKQPDAESDNTALRDEIPPLRYTKAKPMRSKNPKNSEPTLEVYETLDELHKATGQRVFHGFFDPAKKLIVATKQSVAHELGHYYDFQSGRMPFASQAKDRQGKIEVLLRNEIVATVYAFTKEGLNGVSLPYEKQLIDWLNYMRQSKNFGPTPSRSLQELELSHIQDLADWIKQPKHEWFDRLNLMFRDYIAEDYICIGYTKKGRATYVTGAIR